MKKLTIDHKKFALFAYQSEPSPKYQLGDVLYKASENRIGVVIQTFSDGDCRTDDWGMCSESEVEYATIEQVKELRPKLMDDLMITSNRKTRTIAEMALRTDYVLLTAQKQHLLKIISGEEQPNELFLEGLINFIDTFQDIVVEEEWVDEQIVFPNF